MKFINFIFNNDRINTEHKVPFEKEVKMFSNLRKKLSGLSTPMYVIDAPDGSGKIPVVLDFWDCDYSAYRDFTGKKLKPVSPKK